MLCSKTACEDKRKYRVYYWPNRRLQSTFALLTQYRIQQTIIALIDQVQGPHCLALRKSTEITRFTGHMGTKKRTSNRTQPTQPSSSD